MACSSFLGYSFARYLITIQIIRLKWINKQVQNVWNCIWHWSQLVVGLWIYIDACVFLAPTYWNVKPSSSHSLVLLLLSYSWFKLIRAFKWNQTELSHWDVHPRQYNFMWIRKHTVERNSIDIRSIFFGFAWNRRILIFWPINHKML